MSIIFERLKSNYLCSPSYQAMGAYQWGCEAVAVFSEQGHFWIGTPDNIQHLPLDNKPIAKAS